MRFAIAAAKIGSFARKNRAINSYLTCKGFSWRQMTIDLVTGMFCAGADCVSVKD